MAKQRTGGLFFKAGAWYGRWTAQVDGERVRVVRRLSESKSAARKKLARYVAEAVGTAEQIGKGEAFERAAERVHEQRVRDGVASAKDEIARLRAYAFPEIGPLDVRRITSLQVTDALDAAKEAGRARQSVQHLKQDIANVFAALKREGEVTANPASDAELPAYPQEVRKERAVLTDEELVRYLAWEHPDARHAAGVRERQTMACVARMFGGLRTGDLHALRWDAFDCVEGAFTWGYAPRQKTRRPQRLLVPDMLRAILRDWWERHGRPTAGPMFPARRGERASEAASTRDRVAKLKMSHAQAFRRDLMRVFGVEVPKPVVTTRSNGRQLTKTVWKRACDAQGVEVPLTPRQRELFEETEFTLPVDFHSWRRAFSQALADADVNAQQAAALAGHASLEVHLRYLANASKARAIPDAALPRLSIGSAGSLSSIAALKNQSGWRDLNPQQPAPKAGPLPG